MVKLGCGRAHVQLGRLHVHLSPMACAHSSDGIAIIAVGVIAVVFMAIVGTEGLSVCCEGLAYVRWG
eukprot:4794737-Alexandrium_andersonii.AAC.1